MRRLTQTLRDPFERKGVDNLIRFFGHLASGVPPGFQKYTEYFLTLNKLLRCYGRANADNISHLILCCTHHKAGTLLFRKLFIGITYEFGLRIQLYEQDELCDRTEIWCLYENQGVELNKLYKPYRGLHVIRDPRDIVISGYFYHIWCREQWCLQPREDLHGKSYRQRLRELGQEEGILFEMTHVGRHTIKQMHAWDYTNPNILEVKYEDLLTNYEEQFFHIFTFLGFDGQHVKKCISIANKHNINTFSERKIYRDPHIHSPQLQKWKTYFTAKHKAFFKERYGDVLIQLGYEEDYDW